MKIMSVTANRVMSIGKKLMLATGLELFMGACNKQQHIKSSPQADEQGQLDS